METRKPTAKEPNALRQRLPRRATALAQGATLLVAAALLAAIPALFPIGEANAEPDGGALAAAVDGAAAQNGRIVLEPGQPFDLSSASAGSTVFIGTSGTYELHGTTQAHLEIEAQGNADITVRLADGTSIAPDDSGTSTNTSALVINAIAGSSGTPRISIVTEEGAQASLKGANRGSGVSVMVANTNQAAPPATEPVVSFAGESGSTLQVSSDMSTGMALSSALGPNASTAAVAIAGGTFVSTGWGRPAILCGIPLRITGDARVEATSDGEAPAIGNVSGNASVSIEGGSVRAITHENVPGIGSVSGNADVSISGGTVDFRAEGYLHRQTDTPAIGSVEGDATVSVSGGLVIADDLAYGTLVLGSREGDASVRISGGTVDVGFGGAGVPQDGDGTGTLAVTGGSFTGFAMTSGSQPSAHATTGYGTAVYRTFVALEDASPQTAVPSVDIGGVSYETSDLQTSRIRFQEGVYRSGVMLWLPENGEVTGAVDEDGNRYAGEVHPTDLSSPLDYGWLYLTSNLTLDVNTYAGYDGSARVRSGSDEVVVEETVDPNEDGYTLRGFFDAPEGGTLVMNAQYRLAANVEGWTDAAGRWTRTDAPFTLYAQWERTYTVTFDANVPRTASTTVSGSTADVELTTGTAGSLTACGYALAGYRFTGWNTSPDGAGDAYADGDAALDLAEGGETATLYAQWEPLSYTVSFEGGEGAGGQMAAQTFTFDHSAQLDANAFSAPTGAVFLDWRDDTTGKRYSDQAQVVNLCEVNEDGSLAGHTLTAQWARNTVTLTIARDNEPVVLSDPGGSIQLIPEAGGSPVDGFSADTSSPGTYFLAGVAPGTYGVDVNEGSDGGGALPTGGITVTVKTDTPATLSLEYATVKVETQDAGISAWISSPGVEKRVVLVGDAVHVVCGADVDNGYMFDGWSCQGVAPSGFDADSESLEDMTINGPVTLTAHSRSASYTVAFDANGGEGQMAHEAMTCHETRTLDLCAFRRDGYAFAGWNTKADGSGTSYADGAEVTNLALTDGATVTLYAQWAARYTVAFDANAPANASTTVDGSTSALSMIVGRSSKLPSCGFVLPGYSFADWNTAADGSGTSYADGAEVVNLASESGAAVTLYAQWKPLTYRVVLHVGEGSNEQIQRINASFDSAVTLSWQGSVPEGRTIVGWEGLAFDSFYADGFPIANFNRLKSDGTLANDEINLYAVLAETGTVFFSITNDGIGVDLDPAEIQLTSNGTTVTPFADSGTQGLYIAQNVQPGEYDVVIDKYPNEYFAFSRPTLKVASDGSGTYALELFTVRVESDGHVNVSAAIPTHDADWVQVVKNREWGNNLGIRASAHKGYSFGSWTCAGAEPSNLLPYNSNIQVVTLRGPVTFTAHATPNTYRIAFDANGGSGAMAGLEMTYDQAKALPANAFTRPDYRFAGWNTAADGSGDSYADEAEVSNLTDENGATVTLYAQWELLPYEVVFYPNGADTGAMDTQLISLDAETPLATNQFARADHHFVGWNTAADGSGDSYADEEAVLNLTDEAGGRVALYAQWEHDAYTIAFDANGGEGGMAAQTVLTNETVKLDQCAFAREGYSFAGWNTAADGTGTAYADGVEVVNLASEDGVTVTLYAQWAVMPGPDPDSDPDPGPDPEPNPDPGTSDTSDDSDATAADGKEATAKRLSDTGDAVAPLAAAIVATMIAAGAIVACAWSRGRKGR